jgi:hypothetical protein
VHVETVGAAVDLRRPHPDEIEQLLVEPRLTDLPFEAEHGLDDARVDVHEIDSRFHDVFSLHLTKTNQKEPCDTWARPDGVTAGLRRSS